LKVPDMFGVDTMG